MQSLLCPVMVGRDAEVALLRDALDAAARGEGGVIGLLGEAGVGKSRLLREAADVARQRGMTVLTGRAVPRRSQPPLRALAEALQAIAGDVEVLEDARLAPFRPAIDRLLGDQPAATAESGPLVLAEAVVRMLAVLGEGAGCLLVLEDLHWADQESLEVLAYCADHLTDARVLCLASVRTGEGSAAERELRLLGERRAARVVALRRLAPAETDRMLAACLGSDAVPEDLRRFLRDRAEGVPLFLEELLAGLVESDALRRIDGRWEVISRLSPRVPLTFAEAVRRRLDGLDSTARSVIESAALLGRSFDAALLASATGVDEGAVAEALDAAIGLNLLAVDGSELAFRHALSREVVLSDLVPPRRTTRAAAVLAAVEQASPGLPGDWCGLAADLAEQAARPDRAAQLLVELAVRALARGGVTAAKSQLARARTLGEDRSLRLAIDETEAQAAALAGEVPHAAELAARLLPALADEPDGERRRAHLLAALARAAVAAADWSIAQDHLDQLDALLDQHDEPDLRAVALALGAQVAIALGDHDRAAELARTAVDVAGRAAVPAAACEAHEVLGRIVRGRDVEAARAHFAESLRIAEGNELTLWRARALHELGTIDLYTTMERSNLLAARAAAVEAGAVATLALVELHLSSVGIARWEPDAALAPAERCVDLSRRLGLSTLGMGLIHLGCAHAQRGDEQAMERCATEALQAAAGDADVEAGVPGRVRLLDAVRRGAFAEALGHLDAAIAILRREPARSFPFRGLWALLHEVTGTPDAAVRAEARGMADAGMPRNAEALALADAVAAGREGRRPEAERLAAAALASSRRHPANAPWLAINLRLVGEAAITDGWGSPRAWLAEAAAIFDGCGRAELASSCRAVLRRAGAPVPRRGRGESEVPTSLRALGVTSREVDVLRLLRAELTNRQIAERLHLSPRTVDRHVANLLRKTDAADRRTLARFAADVESAPRV